MILMQIVIAVIIPAVMTVWGRRLRMYMPPYGSGGAAYRTSTARRSEETWKYANRLFACMLFAAGVNSAVVAALFMILAVCLTDVNGWALAGLMTLFEAAAVLLIFIVTERLIVMNYDENGELREDDGEKAGSFKEKV